MSDRQPTDRFDTQMAATFDAMWAPLAPLKDALHLLMRFVLAELPDQARVLCVGAGTGAELLYLAGAFVGWTFVVVEPSAPMLGVCRERAEQRGIAARCTFHEGYLDSLAAGAPFDAATAVLVSQFLLDPRERTAFFRAIHQRLRPGGRLVSADLASDRSSREYAELLEVWLRVMGSCGLPDEKLAHMKEAYGRDVAVTPPADIAAMVAAAGFSTPVLFAQTGLIHAWFATV